MGGRGASSGAMNAIAGMRSNQSIHILSYRFSDAKSGLEYLKNKYGWNYDDKMTQMDFRAVSAIANAADVIYNEFPNFDMVKAVKEMPALYADAPAGALANGELYYNVDKHYNDWDTYSREYALNVAIGYRPRGTTAEHDTIHELAHMLTYQVARRMYQNDSDYVAAINRGEPSGIIAIAALASHGQNNLRGMLDNNYSVEDDIKGISEYAFKSYKRGGRIYNEVVAEAVADYVANRNLANPLSKEIWNQLKKQLR